MCEIRCKSVMRIISCTLLDTAMNVNTGGSLRGRGSKVLARERALGS